MTTKSVRIRDGEVRWTSGVGGALLFFGAAGRNGLLVYEAPQGATPEEGDLLIYEFAGAGQLRLLERLEATRTWGAFVLPGPHGHQLLLHRLEADGGAAAVAFLQTGILRRFLNGAGLSRVGGELMFKMKKDARV